MPRLVNLADLPQFTAVNINLDPGHVGGKLVIPFATQIVITWQVAGGKFAHNVLYGRNAGIPAPSVAQAQAIYAAISSGATWTALASHLANVCSIQSVTLTSVHTVDQPSFVSTGSSVPGTNVALAMPSEVALCVTERTALRGTQNRGRIFIGGYATTEVIAGNVVSPSCVTDTQSWAANLRNVINSQNLTLAIGQPARNDYTGSTGTHHAARAANCNVDVTSMIVRDNHWDSQRRRGLK